MSEFRPRESRRWGALVLEILFVIWVIGVNIAYYWQFRDLITLYLARCCTGVRLPW